MMLSSSALFAVLSTLCAIAKGELSGTEPVYINAGPDFTDNHGIAWHSDEKYVDTGSITMTTADIDNTDNPALYQSKRWSPSGMKYEVPVHSVGEYTVVLHFCETQSTVQAPGERLFDVYLENNMVLQDVDVYKEAGNMKRAAVAKRMTVFVNDGLLSIDLRPKIHNPIISGIEIRPTINDEWIDLEEDENYTARHECSFVQAGDKFFLFGGRESPTKLDIYDYESNSWSQGAEVPRPFHHFQATEYEGLIFVIGALETNTFPSEKPTENVYVYDPANDVWMEGSRIPRPRGAGGLVVYNRTFFMLGGNTVGHAGGFVGWLDHYNPATGEWSTLPDAPHSRDHFHAAVVGDKLYACGGRRTRIGNTFRDTLPEVDVYDFTTGKWLDTASTPDDMPTPRAGSATAYFNGKIILAGGESGQSKLAHDDVHALDPSTGKWETLASLNYPRHGTQAIVSGEGVYVIAGSPKRGGGRQTHMEVYNQDLPQGTASVAGSLTSQVVSIAAGEQGTVAIRHSGVGNQGVFVTSLYLSDGANGFKIGNDMSPFMIPIGGEANVEIKNLGKKDSTSAALNVIHSGGKWIRIPLNGQGSVSTGTSMSNSTNSTPPPMENLAIKRLVLVDSSTNSDIIPLDLCDNACGVTSKMNISIRADVYDESIIQEVHLSLTSSVMSHQAVERTAPYTLFGDAKGNYRGSQLDVGEYEVVVQAFSKSGEAGLLATETFSVSE